MEFEHPADALHAISMLSNSTLGGRQIHVSLWGLQCICVAGLFNLSHLKIGGLMQVRPRCQWIVSCCALSQQFASCASQQQLAACCTLLCRFGRTGRTPQHTSLVATVAVAAATAEL